MKKMVLTAVMALSVLAVAAQDSYIVKTKNVRKVTPTADATTATDATPNENTSEPQNFVTKNFKYRSMCDWQEGMRFMVIPEKYDLIVNTFCDAATGKEVANGKLRHKIMIYKNHTTGANGRERVNFICQDDNRSYYFELPHGSFEDYCYGKLGVPTLAYLDDVDRARELLMGQTLITRQPIFFIDTQYDGDGVEQVTIPENTEVVVKAIGVGTRKYPVKIIVEDPKTGKEFFQNVVMSRTNNGMRDDELDVDNKKFLFLNSFDVLTGTEIISADYQQYIGKTIFTKYATEMVSKGDGRIRKVKVPRLMEFLIDDITPQVNSNYVTLTLTEAESRRVYQKDVTFINENVAGDIDGYKEDYFGYLFGFGEGKLRNSTPETRAMIRQGRVAVGMTEEEVELALGEPDTTVDGNNGRVDWVYKRSKKLLIVQFNNLRKVIGVKTQ